jgi:hypothetical protein
MISLQIRELEVAHAGVSFSDASVEATGHRIALVGAWQPFFAFLAGRCLARSGTASIDGDEARNLVLNGQVGVADPELAPYSGCTVADWITAHLRLHGGTTPAASRAAAAALERLGLGYLGRYQTSDLPDQTLYAARLALAASTAPRVVFAGTPSWTRDTAPFENELLDAVAVNSALAVCCDPTLHPELFLSCDTAILRTQGGATCVVPRLVWDQGSRHYVLVALGRRAELVAALEARGVSVVGPQSGGELWVTLPAEADPQHLAAAAVEAGAALDRISPLFVAREQE